MGKIIGAGGVFDGRAPRVDPSQSLHQMQRLLRFHMDKGFVLTAGFMPAIGHRHYMGREGG